MPALLVVPAAAVTAAAAAPVVPVAAALVVPLEAVPVVPAALVVPLEPAALVVPLEPVMPAAQVTLDETVMPVVPATGDWVLADISAQRTRWGLCVRVGLCAMRAMAVPADDALPDHVLARCAQLPRKPDPVALTGERVT